LIPQVVDMLAAYGGTDLLCYRAVGPEALIARQAAAWNPLLDWSADTLGAPLNVTSGVMHIAQPPNSLAALHAPRSRAMSPFQLAAFHDLVAISGFAGPGTGDDARSPCTGRRLDAQPDRRRLAGRALGRR
jgi:chaperone required for assembly of F1-ATPase